MARHVSFALRRRIYLFSERYYWFMHSPVGWRRDVGDLYAIGLLLGISRHKRVLLRHIAP